MLTGAMMASFGPPPATFVGYSLTAGPADSDPTYPYFYPDFAAAGAAAGDYVMIFVQRPDASNGYPTISVAGWSQDNYTWTPGNSFRASVFHKVLTAGDIGCRIFPDASGSTTSTETTFIILVYRGAKSAARMSLNWDGDGGSTHTSSGYVKSYGACGMVGILAHWDINTATPAQSISGGSKVQRVNATNYMRFVVIDALGRSDYPSGAAVSWSGMSTTLGRAMVSMLYELRA